MSTSTASIEKVVRKVLDQELEQRNEAMLAAIERISRVLTEDIIPRLPEESADGGYGEEEPDGDNGRTRAQRAGRPQHGIDDPDEEPGIPDDEDEPAPQTVPQAVSDAFEALYASLTAEQAGALEELFATIADEPADEADEAEDPEAPPPGRPPHKPARPKARHAS